LKVTTENVGTREVALTIEPDMEAIDRAMRKAAKRISRWRPVSGFRPGKAPYGMVERIYGKDLILNEALQEEGDQIYHQAIEEAGIEPYEHGQLEIESQEPLVLKVNVPLAPIVKLGDYHELHIEPEPEVSITDEQVDEEVELIRQRHAEYEPVERPVQSGDQVVASILGTAEGETVIDQKNRTLNVQDELLAPGFTEAIAGMTAGETREFSLTYPEDYEDEDLAGKNVQFSVTVDTVRQVNLPEVNDDLAKMAGDYDTMEELRESLAQSLKERAQAEARRREREAAIDALVEQSTVEYPAKAVEDEINAAINNQRAQIERMGFAFENYLRMVGRTLQDIREEFRPEAERRVVRRLVLTEFARAENLKVSSEELDAEVEAVAAAYGDQAPEIRQRLEQGGARLSIAASLVAEKAMDHLTAMLTGREVAEEAETPEAAEGEAAPEEGAADQTNEE
jgi:trigger factor